MKRTLDFFRKSWIYLLGAAALVWFIIRVIPKPSRATYPCQRAAFPIATAFVIWITGALFSFKFKSGPEELDFSLENVTPGNYVLIVHSGKQRHALPLIIL